MCPVFPGLSITGRSHCPQQRRFRVNYQGNVSALGRRRGLRTGLRYQSYLDDEPGLRDIDPIACSVGLRQSAVTAHELIGERDHV